ncbi:TRAP transporter small permease [Nitratireductor indicus]|uniref:TRAP transporter small permease protein n=1 Tax=Nitratireductor indicus C115 TaxID=1231190 RepID=K2NA59_9HYPH|nr:TRAP transporter small permease [Nitratireductor indicus]EKF44513.1 tripartite ATP-independent periplasmic transporter DctQ [Nitratireductor indicus C115]MDS1137465.1 TRAP transporter small permease [Nitratireductor indicus]SFQ30784.1 TRAP-type C4-dicarboxylate transport system, small permease component [Nitratireductor indicus]
MKHLSRFLRNGERWAMLWLYAYVVLVIVIEVIRRFAFGYSSLWGEEAARYAFVYLVWIGAAVGVRNRSHIRFSAVLDMLPPRPAAAVSAVGNVAIIIFACFAVYWSLEPIATSLKFGSVTEGLRLSRAWFLVAVPFGFSLVLLHAFQALAQDVSDFWHRRVPETGEKLFD